MHGRPCKGKRAAPRAGSMQHCGAIVIHPRRHSPPCGCSTHRLCSGECKNGRWGQPWRIRGVSGFASRTRRQPAEARQCAPAGPPLPLSRCCCCCRAAAVRTFAAIVRRAPLFPVAVGLAGARDRRHAGDGGQQQRGGQHRRQRRRPRQRRHFESGGGKLAVRVLGEVDSCETSK